MLKDRQASQPPVRPSAAASRGKKKNPPSNNHAAAQPKSHPPIGTTSRTQWSKTEEVVIFGDAIKEWDAHGPSTLRPNGKRMSMALFAQLVGVKKKTFEKYAHSDPKKRRTVGKSACRPSIISKENSEFMRDVAIRADRANN